ncbi:hypothetical protein K458DRAFT_365622 [Lentithecium fluviatile CBS 122367]|uniref:Uncharacterized protein n=1 Tax=Lentithecium fluviatile CBS 122367 TaxID=1168545 RepID=A0A6G1J453_9PLEO|nr:hypothetical protein K458DRAFT_365622 [Lentithecium fluviatile CBS 122367]
MVFETLKKVPTVKIERLGTLSKEKDFDIGGRMKRSWTAFSQKTLSMRPRNWNPPALHPVTLSLAILVPLALLATLQVLLHRSQRDNGIIFAADINDLPLSRTFLYQYFPTIIAVFFSMFWAWIDLEVKRLEPYFQLSRPEGALGKDSLLLCYPFGFIPLVPLRALRKRHWTVFWASLALVLVTWGLVPIQAGIFTTSDVSRSFLAEFNVSTSFIPADQQPNALTLRFAQSAYGIVALNETLPPYMTREYMLAPFSPSTAVGASTEEEAEDSAEWVAPTKMYGLELRCEPAIKIQTKGWPVYNSTTGCMMMAGPSGNDTVLAGSGMINAVKPFSTMFAGKWPTESSSVYIDYCPPERNHTFFAAFTRNKERKADPPQNVTAIFCEPFYYEQDVTAVVDSRTKQPTNVTVFGVKQQLPANMFNTTWLEVMMNGGTSSIEVPGDAMPDTVVPSWRGQMLDIDLSYVSDTQPMASMAIIVGNRPLSDYLDWTALADSYQKAWRLLFARAMVDALDVDTPTFEPVIGSRSVISNAVVVEPIFTYIVEGLLGVVSILAMALFFISWTRTTVLHSNPKSLASIMSLVAENETLLADFAKLDCSTLGELQETVKHRTFKLNSDDQKISIDEVHPVMDVEHVSQATNLLKQVQRPVRPIEFSAWVCVPFIALFATMTIGLAVLFIKSKAQAGLPLPSGIKIAQNLLENYIPTASATLIEPVWILFNRLFCLLQPIEELQNCNAKAKVSIDLNYSSLPPQLVIFKASRAGHFVLAVVCAMALLANLLAVAFAGIFHHGLVEIQKPTTFQSPFETMFVSINGTSGPIGNKLAGSDEKSGAYRGGTGKNQFLIAESNLTRGTPLPAWTDAKFFYMPFTPSTNGVDIGVYYEADTTALGAELDCIDLEHGADFHANLTEGVNVTITSGNLRVKCTNPPGFRVDAGPNSGIADGPVCQRGPSALELVLTLETESANASLAEKELCWGAVVLGWVRDTEGSCNLTRKVELNANNSFFVQCQPRIVTGSGRAQVNTEGRLLKNASVLARNLDSDQRKPIFSNGPSDLIAQSNRYLFQLLIPNWHSDSFASDFINYFTAHAVNSSRLLDPTRRLPTLDEVQAPLSKAYSSLFAIWLGANKEQLFVPRANGSTNPTSGWKVAREERLFLSTPLFAIAEGILVLYTIVAVVVYLRRPGEYLPRLPTSIASVVGLFAAGDSVRDMRGTSHFGSKERTNHLQKLDARYGYGSFVGVDGMVHIGIEKALFVRSRSSTTRSGRRN